MLNTNFDIIIILSDKPDQIWSYCQHIGNTQNYIKILS